MFLLYDNRNFLFHVLYYLLFICNDIIHLFKEMYLYKLIKNKVIGNLHGTKRITNI